VVEEMINAKLFYNDTMYSSGIWISRKSENLAPFLMMQEVNENKEKAAGDSDNSTNKEIKPKGKKSGDTNINAP